MRASKGACHFYVWKRQIFSNFWRAILPPSFLYSPSFWITPQQGQFAQALDNQADIFYRLIVIQPVDCLTILVSVSVSVSLSLFVGRSVGPACSICRSVWLSACSPASVCLSVSQSVSLSNCLFSLSFYLSACLSTCWSACLSGCLPFCLLACLSFWSVCRSVFVYLSV